MTQHPAANVVAKGLAISAMAIRNACQLGRNLPLICSGTVGFKAHQSRVLERGEMALHFNSSLMTTEMSFRILDLAVQTCQNQALQNAADTVRQLRQNNLTPLYSVRSALSLSVVVVSSTSMSKLTIETSNAKNLAALLVAFIEFKISTVTLRFGTALVAEIESTASFQDVPRPPKGFQDEITICATVDSNTSLAKNPAKSSMTSLSVQADRASPYSGLQISLRKRSVREPFQYYWDRAQEYGHRSANTLASPELWRPFLELSSLPSEISWEEEAACKTFESEFSHRSANTLASDEFREPYHNSSQSFPSLFDFRFDVDAMGSIARMIWTDECFRKAPYIIVYRHCPLFSKLARLFSFNGVHWCGLRIKNWQNTHGKVGRAKLR